MQIIMGIEYLVGLADQAWAAGRPVEGSADRAALTYLTNIIKNKSTKRIGEIGFNAGLSSYTFLAADPVVQVCSFDLGEYEYVRPAKEYIDHTFPGRHTLT